MKSVLEAMLAHGKTSDGFPVQFLGTLCFMSAKDLSQQCIEGIFSPSALALMERHLEEFFDCLGDTELMVLCQAPTIHSPFARGLIRCLVKRSDNIPKLFSDLGLDIQQIIAHYAGYEEALGFSAAHLVVSLKEHQEVCDLFEKMRM
jgi:hypothetical protein